MMDNPGTYLILQRRSGDRNNGECGNFRAALKDLGITASKIGIFEAYLQLLSRQYPAELHIIQVDNAPAHNLGSSELPDNVILLFQPPACPEVNPAERVREYLKDFLAGSVFSNLDERRTKVPEILASFTDRLIGFLTGWSGILHSLSRSHL
jgi:transposase